MARELDIPHPARARVLRELEADLEDLTRSLREQGLPEERARRRATEMLLPAGPALDALVRIHTPLYGRITRRFSPGGMRTAERVAFVVVTALALALAVTWMARVRLLQDPSPFLWPVLASAGLALAAAAAKAFQLFVKRDHGAERLRPGLGGILGLSVVTLGVGLLGALTDLYVVAARMEVGPPDPGRLLLDFLRRDSVLLLTALTSALAGALAWFLLLQWVAAVEAVESDLGLGTPDRFPHPGPSRPERSET